MRYKLGLRDVAKLLLQRGYTISHETIRPWEHRDRAAARRFLWRLVEVSGRRPLRVTTDHHGSYPKAIRWLVGRTAIHRRDRYLNNQTEQSHRPLKQRYYPMLWFGNFDSASRFCTALDEVHNYFRTPTRYRASNDAISACPVVTS
ncbi:MAG: DDE domain-containing protein [Chloroflexi bacterium]|nr:MAG: DDE domain-containing protein [Chloroflexota bacterium]